MAHSQDGKEYEAEVEQVDAHDSSKNGACSVVDFLRHMSGRVDANLSKHTAQLANHDGKRQARPATRVFEASSYLPVADARSIDPGWNDDGEIGEDVDGKDGVLPMWEDPGAENVAHQSSDSSGDEESCMPRWEGVVWLVDGDDALDESSDEEDANGAIRNFLYA